MIKIIPIAILLALAGCANFLLLKNADEVYAQTEIKKDSYKGITTIISPVISSLDLANSANSSINLRFFKWKNGDSAYQIYISDYNKDWLFYYGAYDDQGAKLDFLSINKSVHSQGVVSTNEVFAINISKDYLVSRAYSGINIKATGKQGDKIFVIPSIYINGFIKKVDGYLAN